MISITNILTSNGNLKTEAHRNIKSQYEAKIVDGLHLTATPNNSYAAHIADAVAEDGQLVPIYAKVEFVITTTDPFVEKDKPARKAKVKEPVTIPSLY